MTDAAPSLELYVPDGRIQKALVVTAHPDDVDFGAAGSVATLTSAGVEVAYCIVTDGDAGGSDLTMPRAEMAAIRRREQTAAAAQVGVHQVEFLGHPDGRLTLTLELRRDVTRVIRRFRPDLVITQSPERDFSRIFASHPDHLAAGEAAVCAVYPDSRNPFAHPELLEAEGLEPHTVGALWMMAGPTSNLAVDTTARFERKVAALQQHRSQVGEGEWIDKRLREWGELTAAAAGLPDGSIAESFRAVATG
ncbi:MAG TPA: PIG-L deacetylase family protein [Acidimicrobiales bacterium]|nr:PIG-L deacetylase family protein [Acidimicrobiales bacterium]